MEVSPDSSEFTNTKSNQIATMTLQRSQNRFAFDIDHHLEKAAKGEVLEEVAIKVICSKVKEILVNESNVHSISSPVTVVGDVHG